MQHNLRKDVKLAAAVLLASSSFFVLTEHAAAQPRRFVDGHISLCGRGTIPVKGICG
jgi:hypothetical protein